MEAQKKKKKTAVTQTGLSYFAKPLSSYIHAKNPGFYAGGVTPARVNLKRFGQRC